MQEIKWPFGHVLVGFFFNHSDTSPFFKFGALPENKTAVYTFILLCDILKDLYKALLPFSAERTVCFLRMICSRVFLNLVSELLQYSYSALRR